MNKIIQNRFERLIAFSIMLSALSIASCKKLVDIPPPTQTLAENKIYATDATAIGVLDGIYTNLTIEDVNNFFQGSRSIGLLAGLAADELGSSSISIPYINFLRNNLSITTAGANFWAPLYSRVYKCNAAIEGLDKSTTLT